LYTFAPKTYDFTLHCDLNPGIDGCYPNNLQVNNGEVYFTAHRDFGQQWYRWDSEKPIIEEEEEMAEEEPPASFIRPNPTSDFIQLSNSYEHIKIYDFQGKCVTEISTYNGNAEIDETQKLMSATLQLVLI